MKFNFKIQQYQTDAVKSVVDVFKWQPFQDKVSYRRDIGSKQMSFLDPEQLSLNLTDEFDDSGFKNESLLISADALLSNVKKVQQNNNVMMSYKLVDSLGACSLDIEMETGTGKNYVYIKTMYELNLKYGWSKFIVVVPSIAIREGVKSHSKLRRTISWNSTIKRLDSSFMIVRT